MSYAQAAAILGVNAKKINNWLTKGKQQMKAELAKEGITNAIE
jgi:DNA-directed RNA polymerase specialized sigma24 family protein